MTDIVKLKQDGTPFYPQTHWNAIEGKPATTKGDKGDPGQAATITVGTVTSGSVASVTNVGNANSARLNFVLPKGDTGPVGPKGEVGPRGPQGPSGQNATTTAVATTSANGLMSKEDKSKLNSLPNITLEKVGTV